MDLVEIVSDMTKIRKSSEAMLKMLNDVARLDAHRTSNIPSLKERVARIERGLERLDQLPTLQAQLREWLTDYGRDLQNSELLYRQRFGTELELELKNSGRSLSGQIPSLRSGFFTLELNFDGAKAALWYGPKQERLGQCRLSVIHVVRCLHSAQNELGSHLSTDILVDKLKIACAQASNKVGEWTPIVTVYSELERQLASMPGSEATKPKKASRYTRADFSYDLFRLRSDSRLHLKVAVRSYTAKRQTFLWVPDDENGSGTAYSHLQITEETP